MGVMPFWVKNWTLSIVWAGILVNHLSWNGKCIERVFKKNSVKPNTASHNHSSWCTDTDGFLEHSPSRGRLYYKGPALQKIIPVSLGPALYRYSRTNLVTPWGKKKKKQNMFLLSFCSAIVSPSSILSRVVQTLLEPQLSWQSSRPQEGRREEVLKSALPSWVGIFVLHNLPSYVSGQNIVKWLLLDRYRGRSSRSVVFIPGSPVLSLQNNQGCFTKGEEEN